MSDTPTPAYGEPWKVGRIDRPMEDRHGHDPLMLHRTASRAVRCVNACAGMVDPAAEIQAMREAIREAHDAIKASPYPDQQTMSDTPTPKTDSEAELTLIDCDDSCVDIYVKRDSKIVDGDIVLADFARQLERERDAALAENDSRLALIKRMHRAITARMSADEPTCEERLELSFAWKEAQKTIDKSKL
jgi:hypothetical protein